MLRHQMENYDGTGNPDRLMKTEIPLTARILRVVNLLEELAMEGVTAPADVAERLRSAAGTLVEPRLAQLAAEYLLVVCTAGWMQGKVLVGVQDLAEGMVLAADIYAVSGMKLMSRDSRLTRSQVEYLRAHQHTDPVVHGIYVLGPSTATV
jgi:hypothetical protein